MIENNIVGMIHCRGCGTEVHVSAKACPKCGASNGSRKDRTTAALLAIFLGGLGVHRFYLGQWTGIFYLLFCWTFIPAVVAFIEGISWFMTSEEKWQSKY
jgi:TM2 domain-containing membrane protein YozV